MKTWWVKSSLPKTLLYYSNRKDHAFLGVIFFLPTENHALAVSLCGNGKALTIITGFYNLFKRPAPPCSNHSVVTFLTKHN